LTNSYCLTGINRSNLAITVTTTTAGAITINKKNKE